jgi:hypothetical protein
MRIEYEISEDDFLAACQLASRITETTFRLWYWRALGTLLIALSIAIVVQSQRWLLEAIVLALGILIVRSTFTTSKKRAHYRKAKNLRDRRSLDATEGTLHFKSSDLNAEASYSFYSKFAEDNHSFVLVNQGGNGFSFIPKRELSPSQITELRSLFETHFTRK